MAVPLYLLDTNILLHLIRGKLTGAYNDATFQLQNQTYTPLVCIVTHGEIWTLARVFFDRKLARPTQQTQTLWIYDLRTNIHFTLKTNTLKRSDLDEFVTCYHPENRHDRRPLWSETTPQGRWRPYRHEDLIQRDKVSLDLFWLKDDSLEDSANLEAPDIIAAEIVEDLRAAPEEFELILEDLTPEA